jgi:hypothetical protein
MHTKQILSLSISIIFFAATGWLLFSHFSADKPSAPVAPLAGVVIPGAPGETNAPRLLPLGHSLDFNVIQKYNGGDIQPFAYPVVGDGEVGVNPADLFKRAAAQ